MATKKKDADRCWPGYEPVPGKEPQEQGSCKPKAESKLTPNEKEFRAARKRQLDDWKKKHPKSPSKAAQGLRKPAAKKTAARKRA